MLSLFPRTIPSQQEDTDGQGQCFPLSQVRSAERITFPWACLSDARQGEKENSTLIAQRNCSPFPFLLIPELSRVGI